MIAQLHTGCLASTSSVGAPQRARSYGGGSAGGTAQRAPTGQRQPSPPLPPFRGRETAPHLSFEQTPLSTLPRSVGPAPAPGATASYTTDDEGHTRHLRHCTAAVACRPVALGLLPTAENSNRDAGGRSGAIEASQAGAAAALPLGGESSSLRPSGVVSRESSEWKFKLKDRNAAPCAALALRSHARHGERAAGRPRTWQCCRRRRWSSPELPRLSLWLGGG
eukprot:COSAG03_NODE_758_length_5973_cov_2.010044_3_plen_222_part_00